MDCSQILPAVRTAIDHLHAGVKAAAGRGHLRHLRHLHAMRPGPVVRAVVAQACRRSVLPAIVAGTVGGGMLAQEVPAARPERLTLPEVPAEVGFNPVSGSVPSAGTEPGTLPILTPWLQSPGSPGTIRFTTTLPVTDPPATLPPTTVPPANVLPVAEPASFGILAAGAGSLLWVRRRRAKPAAGANPHPKPDRRTPAS